MKIKFRTIAQPCEAELKEKSSKFFAYAFPVVSIEEAQLNINELWKLHAKATHICYAYRIGANGDLFRMNDDGEPSGTAGKPIFGQLLSSDLTDVLVCIVRYYGGINLGASGLISAYKDCAKLCLEEAIIIEKSLNQSFLIKTNYELMGVVMNAVKALDMNILEKTFEDEVTILIGIPMDKSVLKIRQLKAVLLNYELDRVSEETRVPDCEITEMTIVKS